MRYETDRHETAEPEANIQLYFFSDLDIAMTSTIVAGPTLVNLGSSGSSKQF